jgi:hypothetical protein
MKNNLEVCVITMRASQLEECLRCLKMTGYKGPIHSIKNVRPMAAAFDQMRNYSEGDWTLQLDEDMFLHPNAMEVISHFITKAEEEQPGKIGLITFKLNDHFFETTIGHLKVWRTEVLKRQHFRDIKGGDRDFNDRMTLFLGYSIMYTGAIIAEHTEKLDSQSIYAKMRDMVQKEVLFGWKIEKERIFDFLASRFLSNPTEPSFMALVGAIDGLIIRDGTELRSKSSEEELKRPSYLLAQAYWYEREKVLRFHEIQQKKDSV